MSAPLKLPLSCLKRQRRERPVDEARHRGEQQERVPKPEDDEQLLEEDVHDEHALNGVRLNVCEDANVDVAIRDDGKNARLLPRLTRQAVEERANN